MRSFRNRFLVVLLLSVWFGATQHCGLEAAGLFSGHVSESAGACCGDKPDACATDGCDTVEGSFSHPSRTELKSITPQIAVINCFAGLNAVSAPQLVEEVLAHPDFERASGWTQNWHFVRRTALSPRAPSASIA